MRYSKYGLVMVLWLLGMSVAMAHVGPEQLKAKPKSDKEKASYRMDCDGAEAQTDLSINNVRARLTTGGDLWWNGGDARYVVPKVDPASGLEEVSSIFAGAVWLGGVDPGGNLKTACQTYGHFSGNNEFWPGPLTDQGQVGVDTCVQWDRFFRVAGTSVLQHRANWAAAVEEGRTELDPDEIPDDIKGWPGLGNDFFFDIHGFELPSGNLGFNGLAGFWDVGGVPGIYEPQFGDFPIVEVRGCDALPNTFPDEMVFWIYNDGGGIHTNSNGDPILMEVQCQSFAYATSDEINDMTFYRYRLINRAIEDIDSTFFAMWVDPDLGCYTDDYVGCDTARSLAYVYNADALDGEATANDCGTGVPTYGLNIPVLGVDYFRGPLDEFGEELGMSSFTYYDNEAYQTIQAMTDPQEAIEYYNYISGSWRDGTTFSYGGTGYNPTNTQTIRYAFTEPPNDATGWSMCSQTLGLGDRRTIQASGPFTLKPGAINELIVGVVWVPDMNYPCPNLSRFFQADDIAQSLFDNCFELTRGPWAPDVDWVELDQEIIAVLSNENPISNNFREGYFEKDLRAPGDDSIYFYEFEGYLVYQLPDANTPSDYSDPDQARLIAQVDIKNGVNTLYNWFPIDNPNKDLPGEPEAIYEPVEEVVAADLGLQHTFRIVEDAYSTGDRALVNHRDYYFTVLAYGYNNWQTFTQQNINPEGQERPFIASDDNIQQYRVTPRPIVDVLLNSEYGDGPQITRLEGRGAGGNFLEIAEEAKAAILDGTSDGSILYAPGQGPVNVKIYNPLEIKDGEFKLYVKDGDLTDDILENDAIWELINLETSEVIASERTIEALNEQIIGEHGFSISLAQTQDAGDLQEGNGVLGIEVNYTDPLGEQWFEGISDVGQPFDWIKTGGGEIDNALDPNSDFNNLLTPGYWQPYTLADFRPINNGNFLVSPAWDNQLRNPQVRANTPLSRLNNVDIVITPDKSLWSRCMVVETASRLFYDENLGSGKPTQNGETMMMVRDVPSVGKNDSDGDGLADPDNSGENGFGWFPGYAIDVETGQRVNIFFGENSTYDCASLTEVGLEDFCDQIPSNGGVGIGRDMMWNPTADVFAEIDNGGNPTDIYPWIAGGQHFIYVTDQPYDECRTMHSELFGASSFAMVAPLSNITWTCMPLASNLLPLGNGETGLIPNEITFKLRVDNPYQVAAGTGENSAHPAYQLTFAGQEADAVTTQEEIDDELDAIGIVPNPYYGYSIYETSQFTNTVKITNLPAKCTVSIYSLDGRFIRQYNRNEEPGAPKGVGAATRQIAPALEWDLKNRSGISIASGTYLIHVDAEGKGERVLKFFAVQRQFDPSGL